MHYALVARKFRMQNAYVFLQFASESVGEWPTRLGPQNRDGRDSLRKYDPDRYSARLCLRHYVFALISKDPLQIALQHNAVRFKYDVLLGATLDLQAV